MQYEVCATKIMEDPSWVESHKKYLKNHPPLLVNVIRYMRRNKSPMVKGLEEIFTLFGDSIMRKEIWHFVNSICVGEPPTDFNPFDVPFELEMSDYEFAVDCNIGTVQHLESLDNFDLSVIRRSPNFLYVRNDILPFSSLDNPEVISMLKEAQAYRVIPEQFSDEEYRKMFVSDMVYDAYGEQGYEKEVATRKDMLQYCSTCLRDELKEYVDFPWTLGMPDKYAKYKGTVERMVHKYNKSCTAGVISTMHFCDEKGIEFLFPILVKYAFEGIDLNTAIKDTDSIVSAYVELCLHEVSENAKKMIADFASVFCEGYTLDSKISDDDALAMYFALSDSYDNFYCCFKRSQWYLGVIAEYVMKYATCTGRTLDVDMIFDIFSYQPLIFNKTEFRSIKEFKGYYSEWLAAQTKVPRIMKKASSSNAFLISG